MTERDTVAPPARTSRLRRFGYVGTALTGTLAALDSVGVYEAHHFLWRPLAVLALAGLAVYLGTGIVDLMRDEPN